MEKKWLKDFQAEVNRLITPAIQRELSKHQFSDFRTSPMSPVMAGGELRTATESLLKRLLNDPKEQERIARGYHILLERLPSLADEKPCRQELEQAGEKFLQDMLELSETLRTHSEEELVLEAHENEAGEQVSEEIKLPSVAELLAISPSTLQTFYKIGRELYSQKQFDDACAVFQFLSVLHTYSAEVWLALGHCHKELKDGFYAIHSYSMAIMMQPENPWLYIHCAECFASLNDRENAQDCLIMAEHFAAGERAAVQLKINEIKSYL